MVHTLQALLFKHTAFTRFNRDTPVLWRHQWWTEEHEAGHTQCTSAPHDCHFDPSHTSTRVRQAPEPSHSAKDTNKLDPIHTPCVTSPQQREHAAFHKLTMTCWSEGINSRAFWITLQPYICSARDKTWPRIRSASANFWSRLPN